MMPIVPHETGDTGDLASRVEREARIVGLKSFTTPTLESVDHRRTQLWTLAFCALVCLAATVALLTSGTSRHFAFADHLGFRIGTVLLVIGLSAYVVEKERHLRRLARLLIDEHVLSAALSNRLKELALLYEAGKALNSVLVVDDVLELILASAFELLEASSGSIMLVEGSDTLVVVCTAGNDSARGARIRVGEGIAGRVAAEQSPVLVQGRISPLRHVAVDSAVCVPLVHRQRTLGVLSLNGNPDRHYSQHDLRSVTMFAEHAAIAVANARLYEAERILSARLSHEVVHDPLTGVANRLLVVERLSHALACSAATQRWTGVLFIDVDDFKILNDELGHDVGDDSLSAIAQRVSLCIGPADTIGRLGGDEFVVVCQDLRDWREATAVADRILGELGKPIVTPSGDRTISVSIGVAACNPGGTMSAEELVREADRAMYQAKSEGKARVVATLHRPVSSSTVASSTVASRPDPPTPAETGASPGGAGSAPRPPVDTQERPALTLAVPHAPATHAADVTVFGPPPAWGASLKPSAESGNAPSGPPAVHHHGELIDTDHGPGAGDRGSGPPVDPA